MEESLSTAVGPAFGRYSAGKIDASGLDAEVKIIMHGAASSPTRAQRHDEITICVHQQV